MPFPGLVPNRVVSSAFPSPSVSRNASTPPPADWSATNTSPLGATAMSRTLAGPPVSVLASYTTRAQKPPGRFRPPLSGSQIVRTAEPGAAIPWDAWAGPVGPRLAWAQATIAASRGTTIRTLRWTRTRPPRSRFGADQFFSDWQEFTGSAWHERYDAREVPTQLTQSQADEPPRYGNEFHIKPLAHIPQRHARRGEPAEPVHAAAGRRRRGAEVDAAQRRAPGERTQRRPRDQLPQRVRTADDVAADVVPVVRLEVVRRHDVAREDEAAKSRCVPLDLRLDRIGRVARPALRHVTVRPGGVLARRRARIVEQALLREDHKRLLARPAAVPRFALGTRDLCERAADVHRSRAAAGFAQPRDRAVERPVELERRGPVAEPGRIAGQTGDTRKLVRRKVAENHVGARQRVHSARRHALAAQRAQSCRECIHHGLGAAARERPAVHVRRGAQHEAEARGRRGLERQRRVRSVSGEQRPRALGRVQARDGASAEQAAGETGPQTQQIPARPPLRPGTDERLDEMSVRRGVGAEPLRGAVQRSREHDRVVVERVRRGHGRIDPLDLQIPERG